MSGAPAQASAYVRRSAEHDNDVLVCVGGEASYELEITAGTITIHHCPMCRVDAAHNVCAVLGERCAVRCSICSGGSLIESRRLVAQRLEWEKELEALRAWEPSHEGGSGREDA